jgi:hypothetical protein
MSGGAEIEVYGLSITQLWANVREHYEAKR